MENKTIGMWINITAIATLILAFSGVDETLIGLVAIVMYVFAFMGANRLSK